MGLDGLIALLSGARETASAEATKASHSMVKLRSATADIVPELNFEALSAYSPVSYDFSESVHDADFFFFKDLPEGSVFCDIGANAGHSVNSLRLVGSRAEVHSFEINPSLYGRLIDCASKYEGPFKLHRTGLSDSEANLPFYIPVVDDTICDTLGSLELASLQSEVILRILDACVSKEWDVVRTTVNVVRFDSLGISPDVVKIDVEGHELAVLRGMVKSLTNDKPILLIENSDPAAFLDFLSDFGYVAASYEPTQSKFYVGSPKSGNNTFYLHAGKFRELEREGRVVLGSMEMAYPHGQSIKDVNVFAGLLASKPTSQDVIDACRTFYGFTPTEEMIEAYKTHSSRRALRNNMMLHLIGHL